MRKSEVLIGRHTMLRNREIGMVSVELEIIPDIYVKLVSYFFL